MRSGEA